MLTSLLCLGSSFEQPGVKNDRLCSAGKQICQRGCQAFRRAMPPLRFGRKCSPVLAVLPLVFPLPDRVLGYSFVVVWVWWRFDFLSPVFFGCPPFYVSGFQMEFTVLVAFPSWADPRQ